jgi:hypothetical protein
VEPDVLIVTIVMGSLAFTGTVASSVWALVHFKLKKKEIEARSGSAEMVPAVDALREEVERLADMCEDTRAQLAETHERLDFAERLLTAGRAPKDKTEA